MFQKEKKRRVRIPGILVLIFLIHFSCNESIDPSDEPLEEVERHYGKQTILGAPIENAYTVDVMRQAWENISKNGRLNDELEISTTHYYVRFLPKNEEEVSLVTEDSSIDLFDYPLLFEIEVMGDYYHDPEVPEGRPTWQYTVVPLNFEFPAVEYEILDELFMVIDEEASETGRINSDLWDMLEYEALLITNNIPDSENGRIAGDKWRPKGQITVEEILYPTINPVPPAIVQGSVPLQMCKVRAQRGVKIASDYTEPDGTFYIATTFRYSVNYSIEFERPNYKVTDAFGFSRNFNGPQLKSPWVIDLSFHDNQYEGWVFATVLNAINDFHLQAEAANLKTPGDGVFINTAKVRPKFEEGVSKAFGQIRNYMPWHFSDPIEFIAKNDVVLYVLFDGGGKLATDHIYSLVMHEMGHVTHYLKSPANCALSIGIVGESWANAIEYYFTLNHFPNQVETPSYPSINGDWNHDENREGVNDKSKTDLLDGESDSWKYTFFLLI